MWRLRRVEMSETPARGGPVSARHLVPPAYSNLTGGSGATAASPAPHPSTTNSIAGQMSNSSRVLIVAERSTARLKRAFERAGHQVSLASIESSVEAAANGAEAVVVVASRDEVVSVARRLKTRFQMPLLPVIALVARPAD